MGPYIKEVVGLYRVLISIVSNRDARDLVQDFQRAYNEL